MARLDDLAAEVKDPDLRRRFQVAIAELKRKQRFGLVYEEHQPETTTLAGLPLHVGATVQRRNGDSDLYQVRDFNGRAKVTIESLEDGEVLHVPKQDLLVVKRFDDPIYPALTSVGSIRRGGADKPHHAVVCGENFHALQLFGYLYEGKVDCIYIDPPYNTGARDWKYNNDYVDENDVCRHSKWLAFMERRLRLAKRLLKPKDSCLIVTIDEKEYLRLGLILEQIFKGCNIQMVSSLINPASVARAGSFGRSDEYIFFVMIGAATPQRVRLSREWVSAKGRTHTGNLRWDLLRRSGEGAARHDSPGCFYPIYVNPTGPVIEEIGEPLPEGEIVPEPREGCVAVLPIRKNRSEGRWQWSPTTIRERLKQGRVRITGSESEGFVVSILKDGEYAKVTRREFNVMGARADGSLIVDDIETTEVLAVPGSQWRISSHDATGLCNKTLDY